MRIYLIVAMLLMATTIHAADLNREISFKQFELSDFGSTQNSSMRCIKGACLDVYTRNPTSSYEKHVDITHLGEIKVESPRYDYFDSQLFQISFRVQSNERDTDLLMDTMGRTLEEEFGFYLAYIHSKDIDAEQSVRLWVYESGDGVRAQLILNKRQGEWDNPLVKIFNKELIESVRLAVNPDYVAQ